MPSIAHFVRLARPADIIAHLEKHIVHHALTPASAARDFIVWFENIAKPAVADRIALEWERVHHMADDTGQAAILAMPEWRERLEEIGGAHARAHWLFLECYSAFRQAEEIRYAEQNQNSTRLWDGFRGPRKREVLDSPESLAVLKEQLQKVLGLKRLLIEIFQRSRQRGDMAERLVTQVTVYSEGPPVDDLEFDHDVLRNRSRRPVRETAIIYESDTGTIEIISQHRDTRRTIAMQFAKTMLDTELTGEYLPPLRLDLSGLIDPHAFPTRAEDGICKVKLTSLTLSSSDERLTQQFSVKFGDPATLHEILSEQYCDANPLNGDLYPWKARIEIMFEPASGLKRGKKLSVDLTNPNKCSLRGKTERERVILNRYLENWGLRVGEAGIKREAA